MIPETGIKKTRGSQLLILIGVTAIVLTIASVAIPNLLRSRIAANEASAVGSIRIINTASVTYREQHPDVGYAQTLSDLAPNVDPILASGQKSGYRFRYKPNTADLDGVVKTYRVEAMPVTTQTGQRRFSSDETGEIRYQVSLAQPEERLADGLPQTTQTQTERTSAKMMRKASLNLIVSEPSMVGEKIRVLAYRLGGYVESVRSSDEGTGSRETSIQIRVPADRFEEARREVRGLGERVKNEQDDARDVTAQHVDLESHLRNYRAEEAQYLEIMRRSGTIKDTLAVSERVADVRGRIERTQGQLDQLTHQTEMAVLEVSLRTEATAQAEDVRWHPVAEIKAAFWTAADDLSTYANFMIAVLFRMPVFALWTFTIVTSSFGGWRLLRWTWKKLVPSPVAAA
jgi:type IV pilus assembly protein PilA